MVRTRRWAAFGIVLLLVASVRSYGQTDPRILVDPWQPGQAIDTSTDAWLGTSLPTKEDHADSVRIDEFHSYGRWRVLPSNRATPTIGYDALYFDVETTDPRLPKHLYNGTVGFAQPVAEINNYFVVVTGAVGYAGDSPLNDPHAVYYTGNVIVGREFSKDRAVVVALNYDGNRSFLPDVPIPGFAFHDRYNQYLTYTVGVPLEEITYEPINGLQIEAGWEFLTTFKEQVGYKFVNHLTVYEQYTDELNAFHQKTLYADHRLFFEQHRVEVGLRYNPTKLIRVSLAGGWQFGQEFSQGFDVRGLNPVRHLRDGPVAHVLLEIGL